jgi:hypothetical protein
LLGSSSALPDLTGKVAADLEASCFFLLPSIVSFGPYCAKSCTPGLKIPPSVGMTMAWVASESNSFVSGDMGSRLDKDLGDLTFFYSLEIFEDFSESIFFGCLFNFFKIDDCFLLCLSDFVFIFA